MCKTPPDIDESLIIETIQEYARRKGLFVSKKEAQYITSGFENKYKRMPSFKEIWSIADKVVLQKSGGEGVSVEAKVEKKLDEMEKMQEVKVERKKAIEESRREGGRPRVAPVVEKIEEEVAPEEKKVAPTAGVKCAFCGAGNPVDSKFCLECGSSLSAPPKEEREEVGVKCGKCGKINPKDEKFCSECGVLLSATKVEAEPSKSKKEERQVKEKPKPVPLPKPVVASKQEIIESIIPTRDESEQVEFEEKSATPSAPAKAGAPVSESAATLLKSREFVLQEKIMAFRDTLKVLDTNKEVLGLFVKKIMSLGDTYRLRDLEEHDILTIHEKAIALRPTYRFYWGSEVDDEKLIGSIKQKLIAIKPSYWFEDAKENKIFTAKGNIFKYEFEIEKDGKEIAEISKKLFKIRDTYGIRVNEDVDNETAMLILGFCIMLQSQKEKEEQGNNGEGGVKGGLKSGLKSGLKLKF